MNKVQKLKYVTTHAGNDKLIIAGIISVISGFVCYIVDSVIVWKRL